MEGWIRLHRKLLDSSVFANADLLKVFVWCLLRATHKEVFVPVTTGRGVSQVRLGPGQLLFGRDSAARDLRMKPTTVRNRIKRLESLGILAIESDSHFSIITVCNWNTYQNSTAENGQPTGQAGDQAIDTQLPGKGQAIATFKNAQNAQPAENAESDETCRGDHRFSWDEETKNEIKELCEDLYSRGTNAVFPAAWSLPASDRELLIKVAALLWMGKLSEHVVHSAVEAVRHRETPPANRIAFFTKVLYDQVGASDLKRMLVSVPTVPSDLRTPKRKPVPA